MHCPACGQHDDRICNKHSASFHCHSLHAAAAHCVMPAGVIPALDLGSDVAAATDPGDLAAARAIIAALAASGAGDLDGWLAAPQRAELLAFATLLQAKLDVATHYTTWIESRGYGEFRKVNT
jgi:hypothetical protein